MKTISTLAAALMIAATAAFAQTGSGTGGTDGGTGGATGTGPASGSTTQGDAGGATDPGNYLTGPNVNRFYTDESMSTLRSSDEMKSTWEGMSQSERDNLKQSCQGNKDSRWSALCNSVGSM